LVALLAKFQGVVYRVPERSLQILNAHTLKADDGTQVHNLAVEQSRFIVELDVARVALYRSMILLPRLDSGFRDTL
jgi:hypothetical protein